MRLALLLCASSALVSVGCSRCGADGAVAELTAIDGEVQADDAADPVAFTPVAVGRRFVVGEAVRTGPEASADLALAGGGTLHVDPDSVVRFARDASAAGRVDVEQGSSTIEAPSDAPIEVETVFGTAHLDARSRTRLGPSQGRFEVIVGHATVEHAGTAAVDLAVGSGVDESGVARAPAPVRTIDVHGGGGGIRLRGASDYAPLAQGRSQVSEGSTLRTDHSTTIDILTADGRIRVQADSEIAITAAAARAARGRFDVQGADETRLEVPGGAIVLSDEDGPASASVEITPGTDAAVVVHSGTVLRETSGGVERLAAAPVEPEAATPTPAPVPTVVPTPSERAHELAAAVVLDAGETVVVHDPRAPTRTRIDAPASCADAQWRLDGRVQSAAAGHVALVSALRPGPHRYELRCTGASRQRGTIRVDRERGVAAMARTAPRTVVDADGRPYSVLYQTLLPEIVLRWPHAAGAGPYTVDVQRGAASRHVSTPTPSYTFASGEIAEGTSTLVFRAADGSRSPPTTLSIHFDNTTPVASIRSPEPGAALSSPVHVAGTVAQGASVSIGGTSVPVDRDARFEASVPIAADGCIAIRVALRGRAVHYYLRCGGAR